MKLLADCRKGAGVLPRTSIMDDGADGLLKVICGVRRVVDTKWTKGEISSKKLLAAVTTQKPLEG